MNNEAKSPRKEVIKNIAIIFLAVLLILTFFSNTFMNYTLPQVSAVYVSQGTISEQIRGSGNVEAAERYEVKFEQTRTIKSIPIKTGQTVEAGDILFELEDSESTELKDAQIKLDTLELEYKKALLTMSEDTKYLSDIAEINNAQNELSKLNAQLAEAENGGNPLVSATDKYNKAKADVDALTRQKETLTSQLTDVDSEDLLNLTGDYYTRLRTAKDLVTDLTAKVEKAQANYDEVSKEVSEKGDSQAKVEAKRNELETEQANLNALYIQLYAATSDADVSTINASISTSSVKITQLERELNNLLTGSVSSSVLKTELTNAENTLKSNQTKLNKAKDELGKEMRSIKLEIKAQLDDITVKLLDATDIMTAAEANKTYAEAAGYLSTAQLTAKITEQKNALDALKSALTVKQSSDTVETETAKLDLAAKEKEIANQKETVNKLKSESFDSVVKAKMSGTISSISVTAGSEAAAGTVAAVIDVSDLGYIVEFSVKNDQAKKVKVGDKAEITSWYWGEDFTATLSGIHTDSANPQTQKILSFTVTGSDITTGQTITLSMGSKGQPYNTVVPNSAIREDSNGKFVLVMESKSSALGNRYSAVRYDVEVLAKDDNNSAVNGLMGSEFVITTSTKPISAGDQIRPAE